MRGLSKKAAKSGSVLHKIYSAVNINNLENKKYLNILFALTIPEVSGIMTLKIL
jgi:hypothetical protein